MRARQIAFYYLLAGVTWIIATDALLRVLPTELALQFSMVKGLTFVSLTALALFLALARWDHQRQTMENALRHSNEKLQESEADLSAIIDNLPDIFYRTDAEGRILRMSHCVSQILGYDEQEMRGRRLADLYVDTTGRDRLLAAMRENGGSVSRFEVAVRHKNGDTVWCSVNARFAHDANGNIIGVEGLSRDITEHHRLEQQLRHLARHDPLTGLLNRAAFTEQVALSLARARRGSSGLGLLFLDLDGFKEINDNCGHEVGDLMLQEVAHRLTKDLRETDIAGRFGGDEFLLLLEGSQLDGGCMVAAERLVNSLRDPFHLCGRDHRISVSIGVAQYPDDGGTPEDLLRHADLAMYIAKSGGKDGFRRYGEDSYTSSLVSVSPSPLSSAGGNP